jgi:hypothetical protein
MVNTAFYGYVLNYYPIKFFMNKHILYKIDINILYIIPAQNLHRTMNPYNHAILNIKINLDIKEIGNKLKRTS